MYVIHELSQRTVVWRSYKRENDTLLGLFGLYSFECMHACMYVHYVCSYYVRTCVRTCHGWQFLPTRIKPVSATVNTASETAGFIRTKH